MQITVYDSNHQNEELDLNVNVLDQTDFNDFWDGTATSFVYDGVTWNIQKSSSGQYRTIRLEAAHNVQAVGELDLILEHAGLPGQISGSDSVQSLYEQPGTSYLRKDDTGTSYPYFTYSYTETEPGYGNYYITMTPSNGSDHTINMGTHNAFTYGKITAFYANENLSWIGMIGMTASTLTSSPYTVIEITQNSSVSSTTYVDVLPSQGETGFKPIKDTNKYGRGGGKKSGQKPTYTSDELEQPGDVDESKASVARAGFLHVYKIDETNLGTLGQILFSSTFYGFITNLFVNPLDAIVSLNIFPYPPTVSGTEAIKLLRWSCNSTVFGVNASGYKVSAQFKTISFGTLNVAEMFESYLDYDATSVSLYLPFIGEIDIDISEIMGGSIGVEYTIDYLTGMCVANVLCKKSIALSPDQSVPTTAQHSYQGNVACQVPLSNISYNNMVGSLVNAASAGLKGGVAGAAGSVVSDLVSGGFKPTVQTKGTIGANAGYCAILYPYIILSRPITAEPDSFQEVMGYPSYCDGRLGECEGLCVCDDINLMGVSGATENEITRIKQMCKEGVYI